MVAVEMRIGGKLAPYCPHWTRIVCFLRIAVLAAIFLRQPSAFAQRTSVTNVPANTSITVTNGTASVSCHLPTFYYYLLQSTTNLADSNSWFNMATASPVSSSNSVSMPGGVALLATNIVGTNCVLTQPTTSRQAAAPASCD